jgi:hypothetical protein
MEVRPDRDSMARIIAQMFYFVKSAAFSVARVVGVDCGAVNDLQLSVGSAQRWVTARVKGGMVAAEARDGDQG